MTGIHVPSFEVDPFLKQQLYLLDIQSRIKEDSKLRSLLEKGDEFMDSFGYCVDFTRDMVEIRPIAAVSMRGTKTKNPHEIYYLRYSGAVYKDGGEFGRKQYDIEIAGRIGGLILPIETKISPSTEEIERFAEHVDTLRNARSDGKLDLNTGLTSIRLPQAVA